MDQSFEQQREYSRRSASEPQSQRLTQKLVFLLSHPQKILALWNWKAAWLSVLLRAPIFITASAHRGLKATLAAVVTECFFCALTAGFYGALIQNLRDATPLWLTAIFLTVLVPSAFQVLEAYLHWARGTPHWRIAEGASIVVSAISSLFNWYAMNRGVLLMGSEGRSFASDLHRLPRLLFSFLGLVPRYVQEQRKRAQ